MRSRFSASLAVAVAVLPTVRSAVLDLPIQFHNGYASVEVEIGTPPNTYLLHFDTGSASTWAVDQDCAVSCDNGSGYTRVGYNASASSTSSYLGTYGTIEYFGGITGGPGASDKFNVVSGDTNFEWNQTFLAADQSSWVNMYADGFLGMAFNTITVADTTTLVETLMHQGSLDENRFSIYYGKEFNETGTDQLEGVLTIGGSKEDQYVDGEITYVPLREEEEYQVWRVSLTSLTGIHKPTGENSAPISTTSSLGESGRAVFDTGAGSIGVPPNKIEDIYESIGMNYTAILAGDHLPMCTEFNSSWSIAFNFGEEESDPKIVMTGDQLANPGFAHQEEACWPPFQDSGFDGFALLGTPLLRQFYTVWSFGAAEVSDYKPTVGFGKLKAEKRPQ